MEKGFCGKRWCERTKSEREKEGERERVTERRRKRERVRRRWRKRERVRERRREREKERQWESHHHSVLSLCRLWDHSMWPGSGPPLAQSQSPVLGCGTYTPTHPAESGEHSITSKYICLRSLSISKRLWNWSINLQSYLSRRRQQTLSISASQACLRPCCLRMGIIVGAVPEQNA